MSDSQDTRRAARKNIERHGKSRTVEYSTWSSIVQRCCNRDNRAFHNYGGRGVAICQRWRECFADFLSDIGLRPSADHSIDRIDNESGYFCGKCDDCESRGVTECNCKWSTRVEQSNNRRTNFVVNFRGEDVTLQQLANRTDINYQTLYTRIVEYGWSAEDATTTAPRIANSTLELDGVTRTISEWSKATGVPANTIRNRLRRNLGATLSLAPIRAAEEIAIDGVSMTIEDWSSRSGVDNTTIRSRIRSGWLPKEAVWSPSGTRKKKPRGR